MEILNTLRRIADAIVTAFAVVLGLVPDPTTAVPVKTHIDHWDQAG